MIAVVETAVARLLEDSSRAFSRGAELLGDGARTARFLRGKLEFDARPDDVFVASYPRSGTTWTQLIAHYLTSGRSEAGFDHISDVAPWFERSLAYRLDAVREFRDMPSPRVFKTHLPWSWLPRGARYIYVQRRPEDVVVSYYHLYRRYLGFEGELSDFFERFVRGDVQYRSWADHVSSWWSAAESVPGVCVLRYEDLAADAQAAIRRIADHLSIDVDDQRVEQVAELTRFSVMKNDESKYDHVGELCRQWGIRDGAFLRAGVVNGGDDQLTPEQKQRLQERTAVPRKRRFEWRLPAFLH